MTDFASSNKIAEMDAALDTASNCRLLASQLKQMKFAPNYHRRLLDNAKKAEQWAVARGTR